MHRERARGALLGLAVGDALGTTMEFTRPDVLPFPALMTGPHREMRGGGPFRVAPGQGTDETQLAAALATSLRTQRGYDVEDAARRYVEWQPHAFDISLQTQRVLSVIKRGAPANEAARELWLVGGRSQLGSGSLGRTAPIGVALAYNKLARREASIKDSRVTHYDPHAVLACVGLNAAIGAAVAEDASTPAELAAAALREIEDAGREIAETTPDESPETIAALGAIKQDLAAAWDYDPKLYGPELNLVEHHGNVRVALRLAFWELLHAPSYEAALLDVVNRGGDADTCGAITGALVGACHGVEAIPAAWRASVFHALADAPASAMRDVYHARVLLELVP